MLNYGHMVAKRVYRAYRAEAPDCRHMLHTCSLKVGRSLTLSTTLSTAIVGNLFVNCQHIHRAIYMNTPHVHVLRQLGC